MDQPSGNGPSQKRYPQELKDRAVRMVHQLTARRIRPTTRWSRARQLGIGVESLPTWVKQADTDAGTRASVEVAGTVKTGDTPSAPRTHPEVASAHRRPCP